MTPGRLPGRSPFVVGRDGEPGVVRAGGAAAHLLLAEEARFLIAGDEGGPRPRYRPGR
jgi:hypothetical protein